RQALRSFPTRRSSDLNFGSRPRNDDCYDQHDFKCSMRRDPEPFPRDPAALWLDEIGALGPEWVDDGELVERSADPDERQRTRYPGQKHNVVHRVPRG